MRSLESQLGRLASSVVETRNSLHCYFALQDCNLLPTSWTEYQQRLIQQQDSDPAIWNPARLMRLVGFDHQKWDAQERSLIQFPVRLVQENDNTFTLDEFNEVLPQWDYERWSRTQRTVERVETDPSLDPWDIRNLATLLDGYNPNGRRGWITCKCPAHNGESDNSLHVEQGTGAYKCHSGCDPKDIYRSALEQARSHGYQLPKQRSAHRFSDLGDWLFKVKRQLNKTLERRNAWGFSRKDKSEDQYKEKDEQSTEAENNQTSQQSTYNRLDDWALSHKRGSKHILDASPPGTGKSFDSGMVTPGLFNARQIIYVSAEHRNVTVPTLKSWSDLESRHQGLYRDEFGKLRRAKLGQPYVISPNCSRNDTINALRRKILQALTHLV